MDPFDDDLTRFAANGATPLPHSTDCGFVEHGGARIWYRSYGSGAPIILLHGGLGNGENWGYQLPALTNAGYRAIVIDSRGHGRSTRDARPFSYDSMASDVLAVMDALHIESAAFVGWSDGATTALTIALQAPERVRRVFFFAGNMDRSALKEMLPSPAIDRIFNRHVRDYERLSSTPDAFDEFSAAVMQMMDSQPNYTALEIATIAVPVAVVCGETDEFLSREHFDYLARTIPGAELFVLPDVSHFAPLQRPAAFSEAIVAFLQSGS